MDWLVNWIKNYVSVAIVAGLLVGGYAIYEMFLGAERDEGGVIIDAGNIDVFDMRVGDCFGSSIDQLGEGDAEVSSVAGVPCSEPHESEVYASFDAGFSSFPGEESLSDSASEECLARFEAFVELPYEDSILDITYMYPTEESWTGAGDRQVSCSVYHMLGEDLIGTARGSRM